MERYSGYYSTANLYNQNKVLLDSFGYKNVQKKRKNLSQQIAGYMESKATRTVAVLCRKSPFKLGQLVQLEDEETMLKVSDVAVELVNEFNPKGLRIATLEVQ